MLLRESGLGLVWGWPNCKVPALGQAMRLTASGDGRREDPGHSADGELGARALIQEIIGVLFGDQLDGDEDFARNRLAGEVVIGALNGDVANFLGHLSG